MNRRMLLTRNSHAAQTVLISAAFMGLGHVAVLHDRKRGIPLMCGESIFLFCAPFLFTKIKCLRLGSASSGNGLFDLIDGITALFVVVFFVAAYIWSIKNATERAANSITEQHSQCKNDIHTSHRLIQTNRFVVGGLLPSVVLVSFFVIVPLLFSAAIAFTNYSAPDHIPPAGSLEWVGAANFAKLFGSDFTWSHTFLRVAVWTVLWGAAATITCYIGGFIMAVVLKKHNGFGGRVLNTILILPYAVPSALSMIVWQNLLNGSFGAVNRTLMAWHLITAPIPWLSDAVIAKGVCILINLWAGFPYFMLLVSGTMTAISTDVYEAAKIDGANSFQILRSITFPLVTYQTMPLLIMSFAHNINNFGAVFFLTGGNPVLADSTMTSAGGTDILVSWIYKLTVNLMKYNYASVLSIVIFLVLVPLSVFNFRRTRSFKDGEL